MRKSDRSSAPSWSVPVTVADIPEEGGHYELSADAVTREGLARLAGLRDILRLDAVFDISRSGEGVAVRGEVSGRVGQICVVTLEPIENDVHETVDLVYAPSATKAGEDLARHGKKSEPPELLVDGIIDLGAVAAEFLILGFDPYPRKEGAEFDQPKKPQDGARPFEALAALKKRP